MKSLSFVSTILVAALAGGIASYAVTSHKENGAVTHTETTYERVMRTNTLRCGYWVYAPSTMMNPATKKLEGFPVAVAEEMARRLDMKIDWVEEVSFGTMLAGLETNRYDAVCTGAFITAGRSRHAEWTVPFVYNGLVPAVRMDDTRFDKDIRLANDPSVTITAMEGDTSNDISMRDFPNATHQASPQNSNYSDRYLDVLGKKADMFFDELGRIETYNANNEVKVKPLNVEHPIRLSPWAMPVKKGEHALAGLLSGSLTEMLYDGSMERLAKPYDLTKGYYFFKPPIGPRE